MSAPISFVIISKNESGAFEIETANTLGDARSLAERKTRTTGSRCTIAQVVAATTQQDVAFNKIETAVTL